jgi:phosphonate transport system substrate-binding protein
MRHFTFALAPTLAGSQVQPPASAEPFRLYLERGMGMPVLLTRLANYAATIEALREGSVDAASIGDLASQQGQAAGGIEPLLKTVVSGNQPSTYRSAIITRHGTGIQGLDMIRDATIALVDGQSTSGYFIPRAMLREAKVDPDQDVDVRLYPGHRAVVEAVIAGEVDAGAAHENYLKPPDLDRGPDYARLRVLARSHEIPRGPVVVNAALDPGIRRRLVEVMLRIHEDDPDAARVLLAQGDRYTSAAPRSNPTLKSIAALAGVSYATVSRVINSSGYVAQSTAERVQAIIDEVGYAPNGNARVLLGRQLPLVGIVLSLTNSGCLADIERLRPDFERAGIPLLICPAGDTLIASQLGQIMRDRRLGALIVGEEYVRDPEILDLARTGQVILAVIPGPVPPGMIGSTMETLVDDILQAVGQLQPVG